MSSTQAIHSNDVTPGDAHTHGHQHGASIGTLFFIYVVLMVLLVLTVVAGYLDIGKRVHFDSLNIIIAMVIAVIKAAFVLWVFMHVKYNTRLIQVFAFSAFFWLGIMLVLTFGDYFSRGTIPKGVDYVSEAHHRNPQTDLQHPETADDETNAVTR